MSIQTPPTKEATVETTETQLSISKDDLFHLLQNGRRRAVLRYFTSRTEQTEFNMRTIAEEIAAWESETTVERLDSDQRQRVYISLYQSHLPKFDEYGVIEYNQSRGLIVPTPLTALFTPYLETEFDAAPHDQRISLSDDHSSIGSAVRSFLNR